MLGKRLNEANKKAEKRWKYYHLDSWLQYIKTGVGRYGMNMSHFPVVGIYRKAKGCECRTCSNMKKEMKRERVLDARREARRVRQEIPES